MRFLIAILLLLLFLLPYAAAEKVTLTAGQSKVFSGKNVSLVAAYSDIVTVRVDGVSKDIKVSVVQTASGIRFNSSSVTVNGVEITVEDVFENQQTAELLVFVGFVCGDNACSSAETSSTCCRDCNCSSGYTCTDNQCIQSSLNKCSLALDCNDNNACTLDLCEGIPRQCYNIQIASCMDNDNCCPAKCYYENDSDCPRNKTNMECFSKKECIDDDSCTLDYCENGKCSHQRNEGCSFNQTCMALNSVESINGTSSYCASDGWQKQKKSGSCTANFECTGTCEEGKCGGDEKAQVKGSKNTLLLVSAGILLAALIFLIFRLKKK